MLKDTVFTVLIGLIIGVFPLIVYNLHAAPGQNTLNVLSALHYAGSIQLARIQEHTHIPLEPQLQGTMLISLPAATGGTSFCYNTNLMLTGYLSSQNLQCSIHQSSLSSILIALVWSVGFMLIWTIAIVLTLKNLWKLSMQTPDQPGSQTQKQEIKRQFARLMLLCSCGLFLLLFIMSPTSAAYPGNSRYLVGLLVATPALIAPLWGLSTDKSIMTLDISNNGHSHKGSWFTFTTFKLVLGHAILLLIGIVLLVGTINAFLEIPTVQANNQQQDTLIHGLLGIKASHIYTDYWTCDSVAFVSREQIICATVDNQLKVQPHYSRYAPYIPIVKADPNSAYVFPIEASQVPAIAKRAALSPGHYQRFVFGDYVVYQPVNSH